MDDLRSEIQGLQKVLGHVHQVGRRSEELKLLLSQCLLTFFSSSVFIGIQLVGAEGDGENSSSSLLASPSSPLHARSPLRNTTLVAVQSFLSNQQQQVKVTADSVPVVDVLNTDILNPIPYKHKHKHECKTASDDPLCRLRLFKNQPFVDVRKGLFPPPRQVSNTPSQLLTPPSLISPNRSIVFSRML